MIQLSSKRLFEITLVTLIIGLFLIQVQNGSFPSMSHMIVISFANFVIAWTEFSFGNLWGTAILLFASILFVVLPIVGVSAISIISKLLGYGIILSLASIIGYKTAQAST